MTSVRFLLGRPPARSRVGGPFPTASRRTGDACFEAPGSPMPQAATRSCAMSRVDGDLAVVAGDQGLALARVDPPGRLVSVASGGPQGASRRPANGPSSMYQRPIRESLLSRTEGE